MKKILAMVAMAVMVGGTALAAGTAATGTKGKAPAKKSLYERLGGLPAEALVVDEFLNKLVADPVITANPHVAEAAGKIPAAYLKFQITTQICQVTGGPCKYTGKTMKVAHKDLMITEKEWDAGVADLVSVLNAHSVPQPEQDDLLKILGTTKKDIVTGGAGTAPAPAASAAATPAMTH